MRKLSELDKDLILVHGSLEIGRAAIKESDRKFKKWWKETEPMTSKRSKYFVEIR